MVLVPGTVIGPYRIQSLIGKGGMGEVYRALDVRLDRDVAIKVLPTEYAADPDRLRRFDQEARAAAALNHPNILALHDIGTHEGAPYIVSELLHGQTLRDLLGHGTLVTRKAVEYAIAVATGLAAAHDKGIVHRDIKPENVFVTGDSHVKILDFGLAKLREPLAGDHDVTQTSGDPQRTQSLIVGTAGYMSPEQVRGQPADHRSDIFSFGAMLYEMVSGERAFTGETPIETLSAILKHDPPVLSAADATIRPGLASVVQHCLEKERDQRFQSARDLAFALRSLSGAPSGIVALDASRTERTRRGPVRWWIGGAALALGLLLAGGAAAYLLRPAVTRELPTFQQLTFRRGHISAARFAPDGQTVISSASWDGKPFELLSTRLDTGESAALPLAKAELESVSRSGDLALIVKDGILARVPIGGSGVRELVDRVRDADWAPDGTLAAVRTDDNERSWVEYPLGHKIYEQATTSINLIRVSPDGAFVATMEQDLFGGGAMWVTIIDRTGANVATSRRWASTVLDSLAWTADSREIWFAGAVDGGHADVNALGRDGTERVVYRPIGSVRVQDIARDGRVLLANDTFRADMEFVDTAQSSERDLTMKDWSRPFSLSSDGTVLGFGDGGRGGTQARGYVRRTDGTPAVLVSESGNPIAFSPDGKWVLTFAAGADHLALVPTGAGAGRSLDPGSLVGFSTRARWLPDGRRIVFVAREANRPFRVFIQSLDGGPPAALTPEDAQSPLAVSPDGTLVAVHNAEGLLSKYPVAGGDPVAVGGALRGDEPLAWSPDARSIFVLNRSTRPAQIFRLDLPSGHRTLWRDVPYGDPAAIERSTLRLVMSADGSKFVYGYQKHLTELYVAEGLR